MNQKYSLKQLKNKAIIENEIIRFFKNTNLQHSVIIALYRGKKIPRYCVPMLRNPKPKPNILLNNNLIEIYFSALKKNSSIIDGVMLIRVDCNTPTLRGFSYRIYPPPLSTPRSKNMGSSYNSSIDFSGVKRIACVYFINKIGVKKFINGKEKILIKDKENDKKQFN